MSNEIACDQEIENSNGNSFDRNTIENIIAQGISNAIPSIIEAIKISMPINENPIIHCKHTHHFIPSPSINGSHDIRIKTPSSKRKKTTTYGYSYKEFYSNKSSKDKGMKPEIAQPASNNKKHARERYFKKALRCNYCKKAGHVPEECRRKRENNVCYKCGDPGHFRHYCPKLSKAPDNKNRNPYEVKENA
ncbi:uncharacterized protein LOC110931285 [Helianthus annuus]|uniref:uncharacterized protein LOC110931285 n=1 Tax=Helianthus annuus TaxID=4232 RepID=UPI000B8FCD5F|nr:uncharacterized protein LOC110931285 [Helianthus annuus]